MATLACIAGETGNLVPVEKSDQVVLTHTLQAIVQTLHKLLIFTTRSQDLLLNMCSVVFEKIGKFLCKKMTAIYLLHFYIPPTAKGYSWIHNYQLFGRLMTFI